MTKARITELESDIKNHDRLIKRKPNSYNTYHLKAEALVEIGKLKSNDPSCYSQALTCYSKAIELDPENALYVADRMKLHVLMGKPELAVQDMQQIKKLPLVEGTRGIYMENTIQEIASLDEIQGTIKELQVEGKIDAKLAGILEKHARVTANLVVQVGAHRITLKEHSEEIASLKAIIKELVAGKNLTDAQVAALEQKTQGLTEEVARNTAKLQGLEKQQIKFASKESLVELYGKLEVSNKATDEHKKTVQGMIRNLEGKIEDCARQEDLEAVAQDVTKLVENDEFKDEVISNLQERIDSIATTGINMAGLEGSAYSDS